MRHFTQGHFSNRTHIMRIGNWLISNALKPKSGSAAKHNECLNAYMNFINRSLDTTID